MPGFSQEIARCFSVFSTQSSRGAKVAEKTSETFKSLNTEGKTEKKERTQREKEKKSFCFKWTDITEDSVFFSVPSVLKTDIKIRFSSALNLILIQEN